MKLQRAIVILLTILVSSQLSAQKLRLGFSASPQLSWMSSTMPGIENNQIKPGIDFGLVADFFLTQNKKYILNTGLTVSSHSNRIAYDLDQPFTFAGANLPAQSEINFNLRYIEIPLMLKLRTAPVRRFTYYGEFGVAGYINIDASAISSDGILDGNNIHDEIEFFNVGMHLGGGAEYDVGGNTSLILGIQYTNGFIDISTIEGLDEKTTLDNIRLVIGVMF